MLRMDQAALVRLLRPFAEISDKQAALTLIYIDILQRWNTRINLTAVRDETEIVIRHFGESFFAAARLLSSQARTSVIDVGSGAGFPGLPMAIYAPGARITLIESNSKKAAFLNEAISAMKLGNAMVFNGRTETFSGNAELVIMRAVENFVKTLPCAFRLVEERGRLALMIGRSQIEATKSSVPSLSWQDPIAVPESKSRVLLVGIKLVKVE